MALLHSTRTSRAIISSVRKGRRNSYQVHRYLSGRDKLFRVSEEVQDALATGKPVVALETTIYTHGKMTRLGTFFATYTKGSFLLRQAFPIPKMSPCPLASNRSSASMAGSLPRSASSMAQPVLVWELRS
jgi:hypothetical protein